jgi:hypothetical protein
LQLQQPASQNSEAVIDRGEFGGPLVHLVLQLSMSFPQRTFRRLPLRDIKNRAMKPPGFT